MALIDTHPAYSDHKEMATLCRDCNAGQQQVKRKGTDYLPDFVPSQGQDYYDAYLQRALFVNYVGDAVDRLVGAIFREPAEMSLPPGLAYIEENATGNGLSLEQVAKELVMDVLLTYRGCILVDYPEVEEGRPAPSAEDVMSNGLAPYLSIYKTENVYNWRSTWRDGKEFLTQVRIKEIEEVEIDEFTTEYETRYRVLDIEEETGYYRQRIYDESSNLIKDFYPKANGAPLKYIPFFIAGADDNTTRIGTAPLYNLAVINIAHYINSADYEDGIHMHGQGTMFIGSDMDSQQFKEANPGGINTGAHSAYFLGSNPFATLLQMGDNSAAKEGMDQKENQMKEFGAEMFDSKGQNQTAEEARIRATSESNSLNTVVDNCSETIKDALMACADFLGIDGSSIEYQLNKEFFPTDETPETSEDLTNIT